MLNNCVLFYAGLIIYSTNFTPYPLGEDPTKLSHVYDLVSHNKLYDNQINLVGCLQIFVRPLFPVLQIFKNAEGGTKGTRFTAKAFCF